MRLRLISLGALLALPLSMHAQTTTYSYSGANFDFSTVNNVDQNPPGTVALPYSTADSVNGSFTITGNIDNLSNAVYYDDAAFSFSDGVQTLSSANGDGIFAEISTDANGDITSYVIQAENGSNGVDIIQIGDEGSPGGFGRYEVSTTDVVAAETNTYGTFSAPISATPEPGSLALMGTGAIGLMAEMRRRMRRA